MYENYDLSLSSINEISSFESTETSISNLSSNCNLLNLACTNARSIVEKIDSLVTLFEENNLSFTILTETWLTQKKCSKRSMDDLLNGANIAFIRKDRSTRGGGVAVCYDVTKIKMTNLSVSQGRGLGEIVCGVGSTSLTKRKIAVIAVYLPPSLRAIEVEQTLDNIIDLVNKVRTRFGDDTVLFIGGDFNKKKLDTLLTAVPSLTPVLAGATRGGAALDEVYTNMDLNITDRKIQRPLISIEGTCSDHSVITASLKLPRNKTVVKTTFKFRPITTDGVNKFGALLAGKDWENIKACTSTGSAMNLDLVLRNFVEQCFPEQTRTIRSNDAPWYNRSIRRAKNRKMRIYKTEGKSQRYHEAKTSYDKLVRKAKKDYLGAIIDKVAFAGNTKAYYAAIRILKTKESPRIWDIHDMFPGMTESNIAEHVANFFNTISQEYIPIPCPATLEKRKEWPVIVQEYQVASRLRSFKKPKSQVPGDICPDLVTKFSDLLAIPLTSIFNQTLGSREWPELWKMESVTVIPKNSCPSSLGELRNLSCTPLFSKVMESFVLDRIKSEVSLSLNQYGGIKGCSTIHFLADTWDQVIRALEDGDTAANLVSIDFEKAFNRMDHLKCLEALTDLGASEESVDWTAAFLYGRKMSVKIGSTRSVPRTVPGGSPQGSILGNFLFCITTNAFAELPLSLIHI